MGRRGLAALLLVLVAAAGGAVVLATRDDGTASGGADYAPDIDPARFTAQVDNPFLPLPPGARWVYDGTTADGAEHTVVEVQAGTKKIMGVDCVIVRDTVSLDGQVVEDTYDWFAQDDEGNVWYFGEDTKEYEEGAVASTAGSWEAGVDGAQPGIAMEAKPKAGDRYRQEYYRGEAEDMGEVLGVDERVDVPFGHFDGVLKTKDTTPLEPDVVEHKYYASGIGLVLELDPTGGSERVELTDFQQ